jgi:polyferredoxin
MLLSCVSFYERNEISEVIKLKMNQRTHFNLEGAGRKIVVEGLVVSDPSWCVQHSICPYHYPISIDMRRPGWMGEPVKGSHCLTCGECVARYPGSVLRFERARLFIKTINSGLMDISTQGMQIIENV